MRKLILLSACLICASVYASTSLEIAISPSMDAAAFISEKDGLIDISTSDDLTNGLSISSGIFGKIYPWLSIGGMVAMDARSLIETEGAFITIPFMAALRFSYPGDGVEIPLTLMAGGHAQTAGERLKFGPAFALSAGIGLRLFDNFFLDVSTWALLLMQFSNDGRTSYQISLRPIALGIRAVF